MECRRIRGADSADRRCLRRPSWLKGGNAGKGLVSMTSVAVGETNDERRRNGAEGPWTQGLRVEGGGLQEACG